MPRYFIFTCETLRVCRPKIWGSNRETIQGIPETTPEAIICATTSSRASGSFGDRLRPLKLEKELLPDLASLSLGSFNFPNSISTNPPSEIRDLLRAMNEVGVRPELEVFEPGMANFAKTLEKEGLLVGKKIFNVLLGNAGSSPFDLSSVGHFASIIPNDSEWAIAGIGRHQKDAIATAIAMGTNIRLGMEDAPNVSKDGQWSNRKAVEFAIFMAEALGRGIETPEAARKKLGLKT